MNNVFYRPRNAAIYYYTGTQTNLQISNNIVDGVTKLLTSVPSGTTTAATMFTDPKVVNAVIEPYDFHLLTVSPAINAGVNLPEVTTDYDGVSRSDGLTDVSASEYAGGVIQKVATPTISPNGGTITDPTMVTIDTTTPGATMRYTVDGSVPGSSSPVYTAPLTISATTTVKAVASASGMTNSDVATASFQLEPWQVDTTPPTVAITSPWDGSRVGGGWTTISAAADDNVGVASVTFAVDGQTIATDTSAPYSTSHRFPKGTHTITVIATDTTGNTGFASITVYR